jgi:glutathione-regulated potassium-efflux system protein KefB
LLGLFFIAVGMSVDLGLVMNRPGAIIGLAAGLIAIKFLLLFVIGRAFLRLREPALSLAVVISQGGEFAFVLFGEAVHHQIMTPHLRDLLIAVVTISMAVTPFLYAVHDRWVRPYLRPAAPARDFDVMPMLDNPVVIAGFGRVGQMVARVLRAKRIGFTALDSNPEHIEFVRRFGNQVFFGDAARLDLLRSAGLERARVFVLAIDTFEASLKIAETVSEHFPQLVIFARARNRSHAYRLFDLGIDHVIRDTFPASLEMTQAVLEELGLPYSDSRRTVERFRDHDEALLAESHKHQGDISKLTEIAMRGRQELERLFADDERQQTRLVS